MNVIIKVRGVQGEGDESPDVSELMTEGVYSPSEEGCAIYYRESELTGLGDTETTVIVMPSKIIVRRRGMFNSEMSFKKGEKHSFLYDTPFGAATLELETRKIEAKFDDLGGELRIEYILNMEHAVVSVNSLSLSVTPITREEDRT